YSTRIPFGTRIKNTFVIEGLFMHQVSVPEDRLETFVNYMRQFFRRAHFYWIELEYFNYQPNQSDGNVMGILEMITCKQLSIAVRIRHLHPNMFKVIHQLNPSKLLNIRLNGHNTPIE
ncbi:hypothetical protein PENTCL1PPCAC_4875, partial [Pristionchus entomophagus]